jgi:DNA mismatch endonuclease (patch repair protein)
VSKLADVFTKEKRSEVMARIRSKDTKIEVLVRKWLFSHGYRFRKNDKRYPGKPDIVLPKYKIAIFVHGCFWHGHEDCKLATIPKTRTEFWVEKINKNLERDSANIESLRTMGWKVIILWECELRKNPELLLSNLVSQLH